VDRLNALVVTVTENMVDTDAWMLMSAIEQLKGVVSVDPHWLAPDDLVTRPDNVVELRRR
jgi:hypothetical protein